MISQVGDVITGIAKQSRPGAVYSVGSLPRGVYGVYRNGVLTHQFHLEAHPPASGGTVKSGPATDANPTGAHLQVTDVNGISARVDAQQFINSLK